MTGGLTREGGVLRLEGVALDEAARRFGTPLFVYSLADVLGRFQRLAGAFTRRKLVCYAMKANSCKAIARGLAKAGAGADIVSAGELVRARAAGFTPDRIVFSGVGKTDEELALGLKTGVKAFNVESAEELEALSRVAARLRRRAPVSIRLNPDVDARTHPHITTGRAENKFCVETPEALRLFRKAHDDRALEVVGLQCHIGSQITDLEPYENAAASVAELAARLEKEGIPLSFADLGGGLGITYKDETPLAPQRVVKAFEKAMKALPKLELLMEPGRYLVADAGVLVTRVLYRKSTTRRRFVIVDGAMTDLPRPALYDAYHPVEAVRPRSGEKTTADVVGPVCETGDFLARQRELPPLERGDLLAVLKAGAYGFAMSSQYNSRPRAAEAVVEGGKLRLARRRETLKDLVRGEL